MSPPGGLAHVEADLRYPDPSLCSSALPGVWSFLRVTQIRRPPEHDVVKSEQYRCPQRKQKEVQKKYRDIYIYIYIYIYRTSRQTQPGIGHSAPAHRGGQLQKSPQANHIGGKLHDATRCKQLRKGAGQGCSHNCPTGKLEP